MFQVRADNWRVNQPIAVQLYLFRVRLSRGLLYPLHASRSPLHGLSRVCVWAALKFKFIHDRWPQKD